MNIFKNLIDKILIFEKEPQKIGLSQLNMNVETKKVDAPIRAKEIKLSDLMRKAS